MIAEELINQMIPPLKPTDSAQKALDWMEKLRITQLPVVDDLSYKGILTEDVIFDQGNTEILISEIRLIAEHNYAYPSSHFYDVIKLATENGLQIVPVIDNEKRFLGVVSITETTSALAKMFASQGPGGIVVISLEPKDYSLAEISRLIEANDAKILSSFFLIEENSNRSKLTLKLNREDLSRIIATLERHNYIVVAHFQETDMLNVDKERLDQLFRYLSI